MKYFKEILKYGIPYKSYVFINVFFNVLYAFFSALSFVSMIPVAKYSFRNNTKDYEKASLRRIF